MDQTAQQLLVPDKPKRGRPPGKRPPGRPLGSRNRRNEEVARYLLGKYGSPLEIQAQVATSPLYKLMKKFKCNALEAAEERRLAAQAVAPYMHQRLPLAVDVTNRRIVQLQITISEAPAEQPAHDDVITVVADLVEVSE